MKIVIANADGGIRLTLTKGNRTWTFPLTHDEVVQLVKVLPSVAAILGDVPKAAEEVAGSVVEPEASVPATVDTPA